MIRILLAVDSEVLRPRLLTILSETPGVQTVHNVADMHQVASEVREFKPDIVILSLLKLSQSSTNRLASLLRAENPHVSLVALTGPFTNRDETVRQEGGGDCAFNVTLGPKQLVNYISSFVTAEAAVTGTSTHCKSHRAKSTQSKRKGILHESENKTKETR